MLLSMTGFGKGEVSAPDGSVFAVQISSVNRRQLEIRFSLPAEFAALEIAGRKMVADEITRGSVQVRCICRQAENAASGGIDTALLDMLIRESRAARVRAKLPPQVAVETLMGMPGVLNRSQPDGDSPAISAAFAGAMSAALADFHRMRLAEGEALKADLAGRLAVLEQYHRELAAMTAGYPAQAKAKIMEKLAAENLPVSADDPALLREILFYVDKGDVTEELTRLGSHFAQFRKFLDASEPVGRNMDFLAQEIFREITTLGNKSAAAGTSPLVVAFKAEMEKIREQIQNIE